jgi:hypothetical protein
MLDAWIIEKIEQERREREIEAQRPVLELPLPPDDWMRQERPEKPSERGVCVIQIV